MLREIMARVQERMRALDLSGNELATRLGTTGSAVSDWFQKDRVPLLHQFVVMPRVLQCDGHWLLAGEGAWHRRGADESADEAAVRGGLATLARLEGAVSEVRKDLLADHARITKVSPPRRPARRS